MTCVAIIPARGGSKGIPNKNLAEVNGESLVTRAINSAVQSGVVDFVVVSSDDHAILKAAKIAGAITPVPGGVGPLTRIGLLKNTFK